MHVPSPTPPETPPGKPKALRPTSPHSVQACLNLGLDPSELYQRPLEHFQEKGLAPELAQLKFDKYEELRMKKIQRAQEERQTLIAQEKEGSGPKRKSGGGGSVAVAGEMGTNMVEVERRRLEAVKRRQEKEIQQMAAYEKKRADIQDAQQKKMEQQAYKEEM